MAENQEPRTAVEPVADVLRRPPWAWITMNEAARALGFAGDGLADPAGAARRWLAGRGCPIVRIGNHWCCRLDRMQEAMARAAPDGARGEGE